jgi:Fe-S cluster biogenesis protein NfuA
MLPRLEELLRDVLAPLIEADGGHIEIVSADAERVVFHLSGACAGCPGVQYTRGHVIIPAVQQALGIEVEVVVDNRRPNAT